MQGIVITISKLSKTSWILIYKFIKSIVSNAEENSKKEALLNLKKIVDGVQLSSNLTLNSTADMDSFSGEEIFTDRMGSFSKDNTCFYILYRKENDTEDFTELVSFVLLQQEFGKSISLYIDVDKLDFKVQQSYLFKCSDFLFLYYEKSSKEESSNIYFINEKKIDKATGEIVFVSPQKRISSLRGEGRGQYSGTSSRRFLPLIKITGNNYRSIFGINENGDSAEQKFVNESIKKIVKDWDNKKALITIRPFLKQIFNRSESPFGQWLESGYFYSYDKELRNFELNKIQGIRKTMQVYKDCIQELVQNIIVHGGKNGMFYCVFDKKNNISDSYGKVIPGFKGYKTDMRFLRIGIFDFGDKGIVDTFCSNKRVMLADFFDTKSIITTGLTRLDMRYAAHLGIKTFVKTIVDHNGYFSVETCQQTGNGMTKKSLHTKLGDNNSYLSEERDVDFVRGTHYEIILPVIESSIQEANSVPVQTTSVSKKFSKLLDTSYPLRAIKLLSRDIEEISLSEDKSVQMECINKVCNEIINMNCGGNQENHKVKNNSDRNEEIALDLDNCYVSPASIFKVVAFLQLTLEHPQKKIVLVNVTNEFAQEFCSLIDKYLVRQSNKEIPVWSRECAIIIFCGGMHSRVVWGRNKDELYYINREYKRLYYNHFLDVKEDHNPFDKNYSNVKECRECAKKFVLPYDVLIKTQGQGRGIAESPFEKFLYQLLRSKIVSKESGLSVNHENTYIGKKIIVKNYYEADSLFQNNFFVERFAYLIACNIIKEINAEKSKYGEKTIVLIGYKYYSEFLLKTIQEQMKSKHILIAICNEGENFNFGINGDGERIEEEILNDPNKFLYSTIVPIGATLSTNDKMISYFKLWLENNKRVQASVENLQFFYNHCAIVVRDKVEGEVTALEYEQKWDETCLADHFILTRYRNAKKVHYTVQIDDGNHGNGNWIKRLNNEISFPEDWTKEKYVNLTENSSINSQNLMDYPRVDTDDVDEEEELEHIFELKDFIYKGHLKKMSCHNKIYVDTENFVRQKKCGNEYKNWLKAQRKRISNSQDALNVLVTPDVESESDFVSSVNDVVFDGSALIIYLDVNNWRNNIVNKLSFLKSIPNVRYHYVDQAFLTGGTYHKSKSYLFSIVDNEKAGFCSAFTIVNRMPYAKNREIKNELNQNLFAYVNIHYPIGKEGEQECELCRLEKYYEDLSRKTVLQSCAEVIRKNKDKIELVELDELKKREREDGNKFKEWQKRIFLRLVITHWLFYKISNVAKLGSDFETKKEMVRKELDGIYSSLCDELEIDDCLLNQKIGLWFNEVKENKELELFPKNKELALDKKISFLKVISSPPLSQYIAIREYAHEKLLEELYKTINKNEQFVVDDLKIVKSIMKSLSFLKSNALVRKDVIVGAWKVLEGVIKGMDEESKVLAVKDFSKDVQFFVKNAIVEDEAKATFLGELLRRGEEMTSFDKIQISNTRLILAKEGINIKNDENHNAFFSAFKDCKYNFLKQEYSRFLVWLFYDNTTIIRNTLTNFSRELEKDDRIFKRFYNGKNIKSIVEFKKVFNEIKKLYETKLKEEYYYSSFMPYLENADGIDFVEKLIYVTYAKLKLEDLTTNKHKTHIETDTHDLMEIFASIMGANAAFWTMKKDDHLYPISTFGNLGNMSRGWDYNEWFLANNYYTSKRIFSDKEEVAFPLIPIYSVYRKYGEFRDLNMARMCILAISEYGEQNNISTGIDSIEVASTITFLYNKENQLFKNEKDFRVNVQENGRLILLLKNEINKYVIDYLIKEKILDLWVAQYMSKRNFEKIYADSSHIFNSVYDEMDEFDTLDTETLQKLSRTWFFLTNETVSFLYSDIARNSIGNGGKHYLNLAPSYIIDKRNTIGDIFSDNFIKLLSELLNTRWKSDGAINKNIICINKTTIDKFKINDTLGNNPIHCKKHIIRTFVTQCLHNSLSPLGKGHRRPNEVKKVDIFISPSAIIIKDCRLNKDKDRRFTENDKKRTERFEEKKKYIKNLNCDEYSSTTLTSLQGFVQYMNDNGEKFSCDYGFIDDNNFKVIIKFNVL